MELKVNIKKMGRKKPDVTTLSYHLPCKPETVRALLEAVCRECVRDYNRRLEAPELLRVMTREETGERAASGKISFGALHGAKRAGEDQALENVFRSFEDGLFRVFLEDRPLEKLDEAIELTEESRVTFVRLTMLAGRMW